MKKKDSTLDTKIRFRTEKELEIRKNEFLKICYLLDKLNIRYFLQTGILLGAIRDNDLIKWDWDIEISVFSDEVIEKIDLLADGIRNTGFEILKEYRELSKLKIDFKGELPIETTKYTINGWCHNKEEKVFWRKKFKVPDHLWKEMRKIELFGKHHLAPYPPEKYLEYQYGDWKTPLISSDKSVYLTKNYSGISPIKEFFKKILNLVR